MSLFGIGIDLVEIQRIAEVLDRRGAAFAQRLFTENERAYCDGHPSPSRHYAARFAAKEAISKALGTGIGGQANWLDIEITHDERGAPKVILTGAAEQFAKQNQITEIKISISHTDAHAIANAIAISIPHSNL